MSEYECEV